MSACKGTAIIYRSAKTGEYLGSEMYCEGDCGPGDKCKAQTQSIRLGGLTLETHFCECQTGDTHPVLVERCHVELVLLKQGDKVLYANGLCFGGKCDPGMECKRWKHTHTAVYKNQAAEVEEYECECGYPSQYHHD